MTASPFLDDAPKREPEEDRLGYRHFSRRLADALRGIRAENGYVVGLQAPWGSGKTSVINFVKAYLSAPANEDLILVDFAPWLIAGHQDLIAGFFKVLSEAISANAARRKGARRRWMQKAAATADPAFKAVGEIAAALNADWAPAVRGAAAVAGNVTTAALSEWAKDPSLQAAHASLKTTLRDGRRRFVVFIDDLDRLEPAEIRALVQMVKSVGSLPRVTYVLAYDRRIIRSALDGAGRDDDAPRYDEKIVQHEVTLPAPRRAALSRLFDEQTKELIGPTLDSGRWRDIVRNGTHRWLKSVRDVVRLSNALAFAAPALEGELDPQDLLAMEGLRLFDDRAFSWVRDHRDFLLGEGYAILMRKEQTAAAIDRLHEALTPATRDSVIALLCTLFPLRAKDLAKSTHPVLVGGETASATATRRGIATADGFTAYFSLSGEVVTISKRDIDLIVGHLDDEVLIADFLSSYVKRRDEDGASLIGPALEELTYRFETGAQPSQALLNVLLREGEAIVRCDDLLGGFASGSLRALTLLVELLLQRAGPELAGAMLSKAIGEGIPASMAAEFWVDRGRDLGVFPMSSPRHEPLISREAFDAMGPKVLARILEDRDKGLLEGASSYRSIQLSWRKLGNSADAGAWIRKVAEADAVNFAKIASGYLIYSSGARAGYYHMRNRPDADDDFSLKDLRRLAAKHEGDPALSDDGRAQIRAVREGAERMLADTDRTPSDISPDEDQ